MDNLILFLYDLMYLNQIHQIKCSKAETALYVDIEVKSDYFILPVKNTIEANMYTKKHIGATKVNNINNGEICIWLDDGSKAQITIHS